MPLTLTITSYQRLSPGQETTKVVDREGASIGRGPDNDWVLPDPERVVSSKHCAISYRDSHYYITDTSVNGVFINQSEQRLGKGNTVELHDGDELILGDYEIQISLSDESGAGTFEFQEDADKTDVYTNPLSNHFKQQSAPPEFPDHDPFSGLPPPDKAKAGQDKRPLSDSSDLLGLESPKPPPWWQTTEADHLPVEQEFFQPPEPVTPPPQPERRASPDAGEPGIPGAGRPPAEQSLIPDDWDAGLEEPFPGESPEPAVPTGREEPIPPSPPAAAEPPAPRSPPRRERPPRAAGEPFSTDIIPEDALEPMPFSPPPAPRPAPPATRAAGAEPRGPRLASSAALPPAAAPGGAAERAVLQAFLAGAGLSHLEIDASDAGQLMTELGAIFRQTVQGLMEVLMTRTNIKSEFRLSQTMIRPVENNPLKFSPNVEEAMVCLLMRRGPAYLPAVRAVKEGFDDIRAHQLAVMAGVQAALLNLLRRFDPQALETRLGQQSVLDNIMPSKRKARYWELFTLLYNEIAKEAEDDFQELFGREFARAYEEQINRL
jgi:type VI secretion system protein